MRNTNHFNKLKEKISSTPSTRCTQKNNLEVHHKNRGLTEEQGLNSLSNAEVLCEKCHDKVIQKLNKPSGNPSFSKETKAKALEKSGNQCECTRKNCHD